MYNFGEQIRRDKKRKKFITAKKYFENLGKF